MVDNTVYGATAAEWAHFDLVLGLTSDLLPVVSNPKAVKSQDSKIQGPGKTPSRYNGGGQMVGFSKWTQYTTTGDDISQWMKQPDYGICVQTRAVRAIDVDVDDPLEASEISAFIFERLGRLLPCRARDNAAKFLLAFVMPGDFTKRRFKTHKGVIEFLATGQQFVAIGTHPSGARYEWVYGLPDDIPSLDTGEFEALWSALNERFGTEESVESRAGVAPTKRRLADDASDPVIDYLFDHWKVYGQDRSGRVDIECPFKDEHTTESGESATSYFPAGVGGFEKGHFKCQHSHCAHRTDMDFLDAVGYAAHGFEVVAETQQPVAEKTTPIVEFCSEDVIGKLTRFRAKGGKNDGKVVPSRGSLEIALAHPQICGTQIAYDEFRDDIMFRDGNIFRPIKDSDYHALALHLEKGDFGFEHIPKELIRDAVMYQAEINTYDSACAWLSGLSWDGKPRIDTFLREYLGTVDVPYTRSVSMYFWTALAGRVMVPGIKADMAPIAVGDQGARKTSLLTVVVPHPDMFIELDVSKKDEDLAREMRGKLLAELAELKGFNGKQLEHLKAFMSRQRELWVPKYKEFATSYPRRCVLFGTTNEDTPLPEDETGQRRFLPFFVSRGFVCDADGFAKLRDQFWAEAAARFATGGITWSPAEVMARQEHFTFEKEDTWTEHLRTWMYAEVMGEPAPIARAAEGLTMNEVLSSGLGIPIRDISMPDQRRAAKCLRQLGFRSAVRDRKKVWVRLPE